MKGLANALAWLGLVSFLAGFGVAIYSASRHDERLAQECAELGGQIVRGGHMKRSRFCRLSNGELIR
jgi:hypothetical protein